MSRLRLEKFVYDAKRQLTKTSLPGEFEAITLDGEPSPLAK